MKKRPPRTVWLLFTSDGGPCDAVCTSKKQADELADELARKCKPLDAYTVVGPYVLAERVRQK